MNKWVRYGVIPLGGALFFASPFASIALMAYLRFEGIVHIRVFKPIYVFTAWWYYAIHYATDQRFTVPVIVTMGVPFFICATALLIGQFKRERSIKPFKQGQTLRPIERSSSRAFGSADWMSQERLKALFGMSNPKWGFIPVGEAYQPPFSDESVMFDENDPDTWEGGGKAELLKHTLEKGAVSGLTFAGSGAYKTMSFVIPACKTWLGSMLVLDPSCQVAPMTADLRRSMGQKVAIMNLNNPSLGSMNVLRRIDQTSPSFTTALEEFVDWCRLEGDKKTNSKEDAFFAPSARELELCFLADLITDTDLSWDVRTVREWRARMTIPEKDMGKELERIFSQSKSPYARQLAGTSMTMPRTAPKTWTGIYKHMTTETSWLANPAVADLLSSDTFDPSDILRGRLTVMIQIKESVLTNIPQVARVIVGTFARIMLDAEGQSATPVPFILDEMRLLRQMSIIGILRDQGRKSKVALFPIWQSIGQMIEDWGRSGRTDWYSSAAWRLYAAVNDPETAKEVMERSGEYTAIQRSEGTSKTRPSAFGSKGGRSIGESHNVSEIKLPLITQYEVQTRIRPDAAFLAVRNEPMALIGRAMWWRRDDMKHLIGQDTYRKAS